MLDKDLKKEDADYSWHCPFCEKIGYTKWNKSCYYQIVEHCQEEHLDQTFGALLNTFKNRSDDNKKAMINQNWGLFNGRIKKE